jgi:hypothetical protein
MYLYEQGNFEKNSYRGKLYFKKKIPGSTPRDSNLT